MPHTSTLTIFMLVQVVHDLISVFLKRIFDFYSSGE